MVLFEASRFEAMPWRRGAGVNCNLSKKRLRWKRPSSTQSRPTLPADMPFPCSSFTREKQQLRLR